MTVLGPVKILAWLLLATAGLRAAETVSVTMTVSPVVVVQLSTASIAFPEITASDFDAGFVEIEAAVSVTLSSNTGWALSVKTAAADLGTVNGYAKPLIDLEWRRSGGTYVPIGSVDVIAESSTQGITNHTVVFDIRMRLHWSRDLPGTYGLYLDLTLAELAP